MRLKTYDIIFALTIETAYLVMMMKMMMVQVICQHVICNLQMMKLLKYSNNKSYYSITSCFMFFMKCNYIYVHFLIFQLEIFPQVFLYPNCHKTYLSDRYIQYHNIYHINHRKRQMIFMMCL